MSKSALQPLKSMTSILARGREVHSSSKIFRKDTSELGRLQDLLEEFKNPSSPFHIPPGEVGPAHENDHSGSRALPSHNHNQPTTSCDPTSSSSSSPSSSSSRTRLSSSTTPLSKPEMEAHVPHMNESSGKFSFYQSDKEKDISRDMARDYFIQEGFDRKGVLEWPVAWGDHDTFQHVNSVRMMEWFESARIRYAETFIDDLPLRDVQNMLQGKGMGFILRDISIRYKFPVNYPDSVIMASIPHSINQARASFGIAHTAWSLKSKRVVATADSTMVMYDYDKLAKGQMSNELRDVLLARAGQ